MTRQNLSEAFWAHAADYGRRPMPQPHVGPRRWLPQVRLVRTHHSCDLMIRLPASRRCAVMIPLLSSEDSV